MALAAGAAYVYRFDGVAWIEQGKLTAADGAAWDCLGWSVAVSDKVALVGALRGTTNGSPNGAAYVYRFDASTATWPLDAKLTASDGKVTAWFGCSVALRGDTALIGSYEADVGNVRSGQAYVFRYNGRFWTEASKLAPLDGERGDQFGYSVALDSGRMLIGARYENERGTSAGAAYVFGSYFHDCNANGYPDECDLAGGSSGDVNADCVPDECEDLNIPPLDYDQDGVPDGCDQCPLTVPGSPVDAAGCPPLIPGDYTRDGDVDADDLTVFEACASGPEIPYTNACAKADFAADAAVDQDDFGIFQRCCSGANIVGNPNCAN